MTIRHSLYLLAVSAALFSVTACDGTSDSRGPDESSQVLAALDCLEPRCISVAAAEEALGFDILEPRHIPDGFHLDERQLLPGPDGRQPGGASPDRAEVSSVSGQGLPQRLVLTYRFQGSANVAPILVTESRMVPPGVTVELVPASPLCGEVGQESVGAVFYVNGFAGIEPGKVEGELLVCALVETPTRDAHTVLVATGDVLVEVLAFPESGLSKDQMLDVALSLAEAE